MIFEVSINGKRHSRVGADDQTSISLHLTGEVFPKPELSVSAFKVLGTQLEKHYRWEFPPLDVGDEVLIRILDSGEVDPPSVVDRSRPSHTPDEQALMAHEIAKTKRITEELNRKIAERRDTPRDQADQESSSHFCSFCGKTQYEVAKLIAGPSVFICSKCVQLCGQILEEENL